MFRVRIERHLQSIRTLYIRLRRIDRCVKPLMKSPGRGGSKYRQNNRAIGTQILLELLNQLLPWKWLNSSGLSRFLGVFTCVKRMSSMVETEHFKVKFETLNYLAFLWLWGVAMGVAHATKSAPTLHSHTTILSAGEHAPHVGYWMARR